MTAEGPVDRQVGAETAEWKGAAVGTKFFLGDAARTADGGAQLTLGGTAKIGMQPRTILRFGRGGKGANQLAVETGAIDLTGSGSYALDVGDVKLSKDGAIRITSTGKGTSTLELLVGDAQITSSSGQTLDLVLGKTLDLALDMPAVGDAGVPDAVVAVADAPIDAPAEPVSGESLVNVKGKKAELQEPGATAWKALPEGKTALAKGSKLRLGAGTTATVSSAGASLEIANGTKVELRKDDGAIAIEAGGGRASTAAGATGKIFVPGGSATVIGAKDSPGELRIDVARDTKITVTKGNAKLAGGPGAELDMNRGETAMLKRNGTINPIEAIPQYYDFAMGVGETLTIHDPKGATAVKFEFAGKCPNGGVIEMDRDARFKTPKLSAGKDSANLMVSGAYAYRLRCSTGGNEGAAVGSGRIAVLRDDGRRALPKAQPTNDIDADGRTWRISYQSVIPSLRVLYKGVPGTTYKLHLASGGKEETFEGGAKISVPGTKLREGTYTYWFDRDGVRDKNVSTLKIDFDQTAPQVYIELPVNGKPFAADVDVKGAVLQGWAAAVGDVTIPIDAQRRFIAKVSPPSGAQALAIKLSHPQRGVHFYLRRPK